LALSFKKDHLRCGLMLSRNYYSVIIYSWAIIYLDSTNETNLSNNKEYSHAHESPTGKDGVEIEINI